MRQLYPYYIISVKNIVAILHIYGARAIFLLFCDQQDTESKSRGTEIGVAGPIFTQKNIEGLMRQQYTYPTIWEKNIVAILHILELEPFYTIL